MKTYAIIVAGGSGQRMGKPIPKQFLELEGRPILFHTIDVFEKTSVIDAVILVVPENHIRFVNDEIVERYSFKKVESIRPGGARRQDSVWEGLSAVRPPCDVVAIHDGVRPFVTPEIITKSVLVARNFKAALVALPVLSTIKCITDDGFVLSTPERRTLVAAQTPQTFDFPLVYDAYAEARRMNFLATDDSQIVERTGTRIVVVQGMPDNIKITTETDLELAEAILRRRRSGSHQESAGHE